MGWIVRVVRSLIGFDILERERDENVLPTLGCILIDDGSTSVVHVHLHLSVGEHAHLFRHVHRGVVGEGSGVDGIFEALMSQFERQPSQRNLIAVVADNP